MRMGMYDEAMRLCSPSRKLILHLQCLLMSIGDAGGMVTFARQFNALRRFFDAIQSVHWQGREGGGGSALEHQLMGTALLRLARFRDEQIRQVLKGNNVMSCHGDVTRLG